LNFFDIKCEDLQAEEIESAQQDASVQVGESDSERSRNPSEEPNEFKLLINDMVAQNKGKSQSKKNELDIIEESKAESDKVHNDDNITPRKMPFSAFPSPMIKRTTMYGPQSSKLSDTVSMVAKSRSV
jgi:hypothetical protein